MTTISLHKYHDQINHLLEDSQYSLAATHCRYILQQYPRHVDTYRLLARTMIEQGDYSGATELFQRVLSADPNDYIAHAGLSVVYREEDVLSQSIWHLERAYEIEPYNGAIQQELKDLYVDFSEKKAWKQQQGEVKLDIPDSLPLTKGALARLYIQGEFYAQAIDILQEAIAEDEDRIDLEVLLVEALWRDNQRKTAVQICLQVLEKLPNCIIANAVLAEIWLRIGRIDEAQNYLKELQALTLMDITNQDLESPAGSAFQPEGAIALPAVFELERMGDEMTSLSDGTSPEIHSDDSAIAAEDGDDYQWLEGLGEELVVGEAEPSPDVPISTVTDSDWLRRELVASDEETAVSDDIAGWLDETDPEASDEQESGIDPLGVMAAGAVAAGVIGSQLKDDDDAQDEDDSFDWLSGESFEDDMLAEDETIFAQIEDAEEAEEMPDWLADMAGDDLEPVQANLEEATIFIEDDEEPDYLSETEDEGEDIYDWLEDVTSDEPVEELEPGEIDLSQFAEFDEKKETADDDGEIVWRLTDELNLPEKAEEIEEAEEDETLQELDGFDFDVSPDKTGELEDVPDWLMGSHGTDELDAASPTEVAGSEVADELAEWVAANQPEMDDAEELPDWLSDEPDTFDTSTPESLVKQTLEVEEEEDDFSTGELPGWMTDSASDIDDSAPLDFAEFDVPDTATPESLVEQTLEVEEEEDDFFTSELPDWMTDSAADIDDSAPLDSAPLILDDAVDDSTPLAEADLPDWLMGGSMDADDSGFLETDNLLDEPDAVPETSGDLPDWLVGDTGGFSDKEEVQSEAPSDADVPDWLSDNLEAEDVQVVEEDENDDGLSGTAVVGGLLGAMAAGAVVKELFDDDDEDNQNQPEQLIQDSSLEDEVTEDAVSDKQDDLIGPQDEPEKADHSPQEESDAFDWLDDLDGSSLNADTDSLAVDDLDDGLDWMDLDSSGDSDELNLDALLGLEREEEPELVAEEVVETDPIDSGLAEDESLDWLDALAGDETEAVDEMPTWQWSEDGDEEPSLAINDTDLGGLETVEPVVEDVDAIFSEEPDEADVVGDLDDAMSWLEDLAAEPDAPVEELPSVAEDMDLDALFAVDSDEEFLNDLTDESGQTETLDEIFAVDTQNDSWLDGLGDGDQDPLPDFLEEDAAFDDGIFELDDEPVDETAVSSTLEEPTEAVDDLGGPPEDIDDAMAWLEQLAARQGADLDELPSVNQEPEEEDGIGVAEVAAGAVALGAIGAALNQDDEESEAEADLIDEAFDFVEAEAASELVEETIDEDDLMAMEVPEDPDEAMAWLEKLAARQGAPLEELPSVSADDEIPAAPEAVVEDDLFGLDTDSDFDDLLAGADVDASMLPELAESDDDALTDLDDAMSWLDGLEEDADLAEAGTEEAFDDFGDFDFGDEETDIFEAEEVLIVEDQPATSTPDALSAELDWLESVTSSDAEPVAYNPDEISVSDDDLSDALDKLALLTVAGAAIGVVSADEEDQLEIEEIVAETAVSEPETSADIPSSDFVEEMPEDPDEAMAWLEKLAARQGANLDELPSVNQDEYDDLAAAGAASRAEAEAEALREEASIVDETLIEDPIIAEEKVEVASPEEMDVDDAMAWLEQLAARQGADLDELPSVNENDLGEDVVAPDWVADAQEEAEEEHLVAEVEPTIEEAGEIAAESDSVDLPEDMDMDDAMAWLEQLAARQGADLDELPSVNETPDADGDIDTPNWIANQTGPLDPGVLESLDMPEVSDESLDSASDEDFFAALDEVPAIEGIETDIKEADSDLAPDLEDLDDSMPDWLSGGEESEDDVALGHTGWLNTLDEPDMGDWLAAEAEASSSSDLLGDAMPEAVDTDSLISTGGLEDTDGLQDRTGRRGTGELRLPDDMAAGSMFTAELDEAQVLADLDLDGFGAGLDQAQLESARSSLASGDIDAALHDFQGLVEAGDSMHTVITELERAAELHQDKPQVRRMLGDAYMRNGQISKAIETYRNALDQM